MSDAEIDAVIAEIDRMARRVGCCFRPDPEKLAAFRAAQRKQREYAAEYRRRNDAIARAKGPAS